MANFSSHNANYQKIAQLANTGEREIYDDRRVSLTSFGMFTELLTKEIFRLDFPNIDSKEWKHYERVNFLGQYRTDYPALVIYDLHQIRRLRNEAAHDEKFVPTEKQVFDVDRQAFEIWQWFLKTYSLEDAEETETVIYQKPVDQKQRLKDAQTKINELEKQLAQQQSQAPVAPKVTEAERKRRRKVNLQYAKEHQLTESETREMIDEQLREAGWEADTTELNNFTKQTVPQKNHNMAIAEWVFPDHTKADYALFIGLKFVGIVEAKRFDEDIAGQFSQPRDYAKRAVAQSCKLLDLNMAHNYKVPFIYTANGRPYIKQYEEKSGIWFWDARNLAESEHALEAFHSPADIELKLTSQSKTKTNQALMHDDNFPAFASRPYQIEAVKAIEQGIVQGKRRLLIAMATGTGKTRTALSLMYRLIFNKRARRILYLVDRKALGEQVANALKDNKVKDRALSELYQVKELNDRIPEDTTRIQIATVQGMIKRLFFNEDFASRPSVGAYDIIIVDEAHRGYNEDKELSDSEYKFYDQNDYISQYRRVIDYFDAVAVGMTATPALQTTEIFGMPSYTYSYKQAVLDGYLVDHDVPRIIKTELNQKGIHIKKDQEVEYYDPNIQEINKAKMSENIDFEVKDFNKKVITPEFNQTVCDALAEQLDPNDRTMGKTLIFAASDQHADLVVDCLKKAFAKQGNAVPADAIEKITGYIRNPEEEIRKFKNEKFPNVVVTVDLLTTGIDVPEICNLVFLRLVKSRILYEQMLGRATRLCPEIQKDHFAIYDAVGIYDVMNDVTDMKPVVKNAHHDLRYFVQRKDDYFNDKVNEETKAEEQYKIDIVAAVNRKVQRLDDHNRHEFERLSQVGSLEEWSHTLARMKKPQFLKQWSNIELLSRFKNPKDRQLISHEQDKLVRVDRGYGDQDIKPKDYLEQFTAFIKDNINRIPALQIIATRPKDLTLKELKEIRLELERHNYSEDDLQLAYKNANNIATTADIISFIRHASVGSALVDHDIRIKNAMKKVYQMHDWSSKQEAWLKRIEKQLIKEDILGPNAQRAFDDNSIFRDNGGYKQMKRIFADDTDKIIDVINDELYA